MEPEITGPVARIVGAGPGISATFGEALVADGYRVALAARLRDRLEPLSARATRRGRH